MDVSTCPRGFRCEDGDAFMCFGYTGLQVEESLSALFANQSEDDHVLRNIGIILGLAAIIILVAAAYLIISTRTRIHLAAPHSAEQHVGPTSLSSPSASTSAMSAPDLVTASQASEPVNPAVPGTASPMIDLSANSVAATAAFKLAIRNLSVQVLSNSNASPGGSAGGVSLLRHIDASCDSGETLSVLGPSGGGKTTLLNALDGESGTPRGLSISGQVTLNGTELTPQIFRERCAYVEQSDSGLWPMLSGLEQVHFTVACRCADLNAAESTRRTNELLASLGLGGCQHVHAGNVETKGLSGGQRRRLSLAIALAKSPAVLMADEPTSGLDSAAAAAIMRLLGELARDSRVAVVCTIHQPSSAVFAGLDKLLLLTKGCTVYAGAASGLGDYLVSLKLPVPPGMSTVEHALQLTNADFTSATAVDALIGAWAAQHRTVATAPAAVIAMPARPQTADGFRRFRLLFVRLAVVFFNDRRILFLPIVSSVVLISLLTLVIAPGVRDQDQNAVWTVWTLLYSLILLVGVNSSMISFLAYCEWWPLSRREIRSGTYGPITYWSALTLAGLPFHTLTSLVAVVAMFATANLPFAAVPTAWAALTLFSLEGHAFTLLGSFLGRDLGLLPIGVHLMHTAISTGFFLSLGSVIWPLKLFQYILGGKYTFAILAYKTFSETGTWEGAFPLSGANLSDIEVGLVATAQNRSFYCPDEVAATDCYGITGRDVLTSLQARFPALCCLLCPRESISPLGHGGLPCS